MSETDKEVKSFFKQLDPRVFITTYIFLLQKEKSCLGLFEPIYSELAYGNVTGVANGHVNHITTNFNLMQHHKYSELLDNMKPSERKTYIQMLIEHLREEEERLDRE